MNVAILTGGSAAELEISLKSAETIYTNLKAPYHPRIIEIHGKDFVDRKSGRMVDLNDFSLETDSGRFQFDAVFLCIHGTPGEDGKIQGYFELQGIPVTGCDSICSAITFNKQVTKEVLKHYTIPMADSVLLYRGQPIERSRIEALGYPMFVKPNKNGSSYGVTKVNAREELDEAIEMGFQYDDQIIIEGFLEGVEYSCGLFLDRKTLHAFPITEIIPQNDFFDYAAKYKNESQEITPARLSQSDVETCQQRSKEIYRILDCKGMVRVDYIKVGDEFYFLEVNTIPGLSAESIIPQQVRAYGWDLETFFSKVVENAIT